MGLVANMSMGLHLVAALTLVLLCTTGAVPNAPKAAKSTPPGPPSPVTAQTLRNVAASLKMYVDPLPDIPKVYGYRTQKHGKPIPRPLTIGMWAKTWKFHRDFPPTPVFVFGTSIQNATFPGPTIYARQGTPLQIRWENHLPLKHILPWDPTVPTAIPKRGGVPTVVHLHGSAHPPQSDGSANAWFTNGFQETGPVWSQATYTYPNVQPPGNLWYHDHALGLTRVNLLAGLLGAYVIHKPEIDDVLSLPEGSKFDRHLIIVDRSFNVDGSLYMNFTGNDPSVHPQWQPEYFGETIVVNGKAWPYLTVQKRKYRFRILNASNARYFRLSITDINLPFYIVGSDASYLNAPVKAKDFLLAPAEFIDVVVDFSVTNATSAEIVNDAAYPYPTGTAPGPLVGKVMKFNIVPMTKNEAPDKSEVPVKEVTYATVTTDASVTRYLTLYESLNPTTGQSNRLYINGLRFEDPVTETPRTGSTELWNVINLTGDNHPFHIHLGMFQAIKVQELLDYQTFFDCMTAVNDAVKCNISAHAVGKIIPINDHEKTWKNIIKLEPGYMTSIIIKFKIVDNNETFPFDVTAEPGYVYHCHILDHEDNAMIRPMKLLP